MVRTLLVGERGRSAVMKDAYYKRLAFTDHFFDFRSELRVTVA